MSINLANWMYFAYIILILILAGVGEYLHIIPAGTFGSLLLVAIGIISPSPLLNHPTTLVTANTAQVVPPKATTNQG